MIARSIGLSVVLGAMSFASADTIHFLTDTRRCVAAFGGNGSGSAWQDRPVAFQQYQGGVTINPTNGLETWYGESDQVSWMNGESMSLTAAAHATVTGQPSSHLFAQGQTTFNILFSLSTPGAYSLSGSVSQTGNPQSNAQVTLTDESGHQIESIVSSPNNPDFFNRQGELAPGNYRVEATVLGRAQTPGPLSSGDALCFLLLSVTPSDGCPADWNRDGIVDTQDFYAFLADFLAGNADFDHSGSTDVQDFLAFLLSFDGGC